jgi:uncharacterized protein (TIGR02246 family)
MASEVPRPATRFAIAEPFVPMTSPEQHAARIRALDDGWLRAAERRDLDGMMSIYAADAQELLPAAPAVVGRAAIRDFYAALMARFPRFRHRFELERITVAASGDLAVARGSYQFTPDTDQPDHVFRGKFLGVWRFQDGDWRLQYNISNGDATDL